MYSIKEVQAMDYLLKRLQYNGLLEQITGENSELKLVIIYNNKYIFGDFINYQKGTIQQYEFNGPFVYEVIHYYNQSIEMFTQLWELFCERYFPRNSTSTFKRIEDLSVLLELLSTHIKSVDISNNSTPLRPLIINVNYFSNEPGPDFLYLVEKQIDVISIVQVQKEN